MAEKFTKDTGMMQRDHVKFSFNQPEDMDGLRDALKAMAASVPKARPGDWLGDALRRENAARCSDILATVGLADDGKCCADLDGLRQRGLAENTAQWIAAHWLAEYNTLMRARARFAEGDAGSNELCRMLMAAEEMGRLQERMWWRAGVDNETRAKREVLALERKKSRLALQSNPDRNYERQLTAAAWLKVAQRLADEYWQRRPGASKSEVAGAVIRNWPQDDGGPKPPGLSSIRQKIAPPTNS